MVVTFIVDKPGLIIVLDNIRIGSIDNVAPIAGENTMVFEFVRSSFPRCWRVKLWPGFLEKSQ